MAPKAVAKASGGVSTRLRSRGKAAEPTTTPKSSPAKKRKVTFDGDDEAADAQSESKAKKAKAGPASSKKATAVLSPKKTPAKKSPVKTKSPKKSPVKTVTETMSAKKSAKVRVEIEIPFSPDASTKANTPEPKSPSKKVTRKAAPKVKCPKKTTVKSPKKASAKATKGKTERRLTIDVAPKGKSPKKAAAVKRAKSASSPDKSEDGNRWRKFAPEFKKLSERWLDFADKVPPIVEAIDAIKHLLEQQAIYLKALQEQQVSAKALQEQSKMAAVLPAQLLPELTELDTPWRELIREESPDVAQLNETLKAFTRHRHNQKARSAKEQSWLQHPDESSMIDRVTGWLADRKFVGEPALLSPISDFSSVATSSSALVSSPQRKGSTSKTASAQLQSPQEKGSAIKAASSNSQERTTNTTPTTSVSPARPGTSRRSQSPARAISGGANERSLQPAVTLQIPNLPASPVRSVGRTRSKTPVPSEPPKQQVSPRKASSPKKVTSPKRIVEQPRAPTPARSPSPGGRLIGNVVAAPKKHAMYTLQDMRPSPGPISQPPPPTNPLPTTAQTVRSPRKVSSPAKEVIFIQNRTVSAGPNQVGLPTTKPGSPKRARSPSKQLASEELQSPSEASFRSEHVFLAKSPARPAASPKAMTVSSLQSPTRSQSKSPTKAMSPNKTVTSTRSHPRGLDELVSQVPLTARSPSKVSLSKQRPLLEPASPLKSKSPIPGVAVEELRASRKVSSSRKISSPQKVSSPVKNLSPRRVISPSKVPAATVQLSSKQNRSPSKQLSPGRTTTWTEEPWHPQRRDGRPLSPNAIVPNTRKGKSVEPAEDIDAVWGPDTVWPENPLPEFPDFDQFPTEYVVRGIDGTPLYDIRTKLPYNKVDHELEDKYLLLQRAVFQCAAIYCDYNVLEENKKHFLSLIKAKALSAFATLADRVACSGPHGKEGWQEILTVKPLRVALVAAMINQILKEHVFECPMFGGSLEQEKAVMDHERATAQDEGFESFRSRAELIRKLLDEQPGGLSLPHMFRQRVVEVVCAIFTILEPLIGPHHFPDNVPAIKAKLFEDLVTIAQKTGEMSLVMKADLNSVYTLQPVYKDMPFDEDAMLDLRSIPSPEIPRAANAPAPKNIVSLDEYLNEQNPKPEKPQTGKWTDSLNFMMGKEKPRVRITVCDALMAYRKGGWRTTDANVGHRVKRLGKARVVTRYGPGKKMKPKDGKKKEDDGFRSLREIMDKKELDKIGNSGLFGSWFGGS